MNKCVVFDLDETIGYFAQVYKIAKAFEKNFTYKFEKHHILLLYKHFYNMFRPGIFTLLAYAQYLKEKYNVQIILYTNTVMENIWVDSFLQYSYEMVRLQFSNVIYLNSKCRSGVKKSTLDLYSCTASLNNMSSIMIIDNKKHKHLLQKNIEYVVIKTYFYLYENSLIWEKMHNIFNIPKKINIEKNILDHEFNEVLLKNTKSEILTIMSKVKHFSKCL
tara:strand:- start:2067 stop:2723 length:657 start_codon:yes stop_codon:yes gene_type:complete